MALISGVGGTFIYDVTDPVHPQAVCQIAHTSARILTGTSFEYLVPHPNGTTDVVLHSLGSNSEAVAATFRADLWNGNIESPFASVAWYAAPKVIGYSTDGGTDANGQGVTDVWVATTTAVSKLYSYSVPGVDAFARPGLPAPVLAISPDEAYVAAGWAIHNTIHVFRLSDNADVSPPGPNDAWSAVWSERGHTLYLIGRTGVQLWTPESGVSDLPNTTGWVLQPNFAPDGSQLAFTAVDANHNIRSYVYDFTAKASRVLIDQPRSGAMFVKSNWIWLLEEATCQPSSNQVCFDPTLPDGNVLAMNVATGAERAVSFATGESPLQLPYGVYMSRVDIWPKV